MPATGTIPGSSSGAVVSANPLVVDVTKYGAVGDWGKSGGNADNTAAFNAAYDYLIANSLASQNAGRKAWIYVPASKYPYRIGRPFKIRHPYVGIYGDGPGASEIICQNGPPLVVGIRESEAAPASGTTVLDASYRPTRTGVLDGTFGGHGHRLKNATIVFSSCPLTLGPRGGPGRMGWRGATSVTVEVAIRRQDGGVWPSGSLSGIWQFGGLSVGSGFGSMPPVFTLLKGGGQNQFDLKITDSGNNDGTATFSAGAATGLIKICFQIDMANKVVLAWINGVQVAVTLSGAAFGGGGTGALLGHDFNSFIFGVDTQSCTGNVPLFTPVVNTMVDFTVYGFAVTARLRYYNDGVGQPQRRIDGQAVNDGNRFGGGNFSDNTLLCYLRGDDTTGSTDAERGVRATSLENFSVYEGVFLQTAQYVIEGGMIGNSVKDLSLDANWGHGNASLVLGNTLMTLVKNVHFKRGSCGVHVLPLGANYTHTFEDLEFYGTSDCAVSLAWSIVHARNWKVQNAGRCTFRSWASSIALENADVAFASSGGERLISCIAGQYGGRIDFRNLTFDFEGDTLSRSPLYFEQHPAANQDVTIDTVYLGSSANGQPVFELFSASDQSKRCKMAALRIDPGSTAYSSPAKVTGSGWSGSIELTENKGVPPVFVPTNGSTNNVSITY